MNKKHYFISPLALSFWLPALVILGYFVYRGMAPFGPNSILTVDLGQQYIDQFAAFKHTFLSHPTSFFYSFSNALGGDMLGEWAYYLMSPFNVIYLFTPIVHLPSAILFVTVLKFGSAGLSMAWLLKQLQLQRGYYITLFAVNYALSGWFIANDLNLLWLDAAILLPILIVQIEALFKQNNWWRYALILSLTITSNYYIGYMITLFVILYFIWRLTWPNQIKQRWQVIKHFVYGSLLAGVLSAWLILPTYYQLRLGKAQYNTNWSFKFDNDPVKLILKLIPGSFDFNQMQSGQANFFVSAFILFTVISFFVVKTVHWRIKIGALLLLGILLIATTWAPLTIIFHGMQYPVWYPYRFSFLISFMFIYLGALAWQPNQPLNLMSSSLSLVCIITITFYAYQQSHHLSYIDQRSISLFAILAMLILAQLMFPSQNRYQWLLLSFTVLMLVVNVLLTLNRFSYLTNTEYQRTIKSLTPAIKKIKTDRTFYRIAQTFQRTRGDSMMLDFYGGSHFSSTLPKATPTFFGNIGQPDGDNYVAYSNGSLLSDALLDMKYIVAPNNQDKHLPGDPSTHLIGYRPDTSKYHLKAVTDKTSVWENPYALPLAFAASDTVLKTAMLLNNPMQNQNNIWQGLNAQKAPLVTAENFSQAVGHNVNTPATITDALLVKNKPNEPASLDLTFNPKTNDSYYLTLGSGLPIKDFDLLINGQVITQFNSYRHTVIINLASQVKNKPQTVTIRFKQTRSLLLNNVTLYRISQDNFQQQVNQLKAHPLTIDEYRDNKITGNITTTKQQPLLMTTIPSTPGWQVLVDGKRVKTEKVANYFIAVRTAPGKHHVTFKYTPPFFWLGVMLTGTAVLILGIFQFYYKMLARKRSA